MACSIWRDLVGRLSGWVATYLIIALLFGWWPFEDSAIKTFTGQCSYDAGYQDGWDGSLPNCEASDYIAGYDDGAFDSDCDWAKCTKRDFKTFKRYGCGSWERQAC